MDRQRWKSGARETHRRQRGVCHLSSRPVRRHPIRPCCELRTAEARLSTSRFERRKRTLVRLRTRRWQIGEPNGLRSRECLDQDVPGCSLARPHTVAWNRSSNRSNSRRPYTTVSEGTLQSPTTGWKRQSSKRTPRSATATASSIASTRRPGDSNCSFDIRSFRACRRATSYLRGRRGGVGSLIVPLYQCGRSRDDAERLGITRCRVNIHLFRIYFFDPRNLIVPLQRVRIVSEHPAELNARLAQLSAVPPIIDSGRLQTSPLETCSAIRQAVQRNKT